MAPPRAGNVLFDPVGMSHCCDGCDRRTAAWNAINYDIDLGHFYTWRWNISADFDADGKLRPAYLNGDPVLEGGSPKKIVSKVAEEGKEASIYRVQRPRPKAFKGGKSLGCLLFDRDGDLKTTNDQATAGGGPTRPPRASLD